MYGVRGGGAVVEQKEGGRKGNLKNKKHARTSCCVCFSDSISCLYFCRTDKEWERRRIENKLYIKDEKKKKEKAV